MGSNKKIGRIAGFLFIGLIFSGTIVIFYSRLDSTNSYVTRDRRQAYPWNLLGPSSPECPIFKSCSASSVPVSSCQLQTTCTPLNQFCCPGMDGVFCCQNQSAPPFPVVPSVGTVTTVAFTGSTTLSSSTVTGLTATTNNFTTTPFTGTTATPGTGSTSTGTTNIGSTSSTTAGTATTGTGTATTATTVAGQTTGAATTAPSTTASTPAAG